ncbi:filamentous hemagglutinin N-terminal domain-containing protein [Aliarcobacter sp. ERUVET-8]|uniref:two-partner secretion domain-containing protein n=1 Tax=Aliarcobacter sp. ERUVET-8 TaxID=3429684 RepID=UPI003D6A0675
MNFIPNYKNSFRILKGGKISLVVSSFLASTTLSFAAPSGGVVTSGSANISQNGKVTDITQSTQKASINWNKFNIASDETVNFKQPNSSSITLNRVVGNERSVINGALNANGQVWILNSNGVLFGKNASINTAGLLATTKELSDTDFQAGNYNFKGDSTASVINLGEIDISDSGYATLLANTVSNEGTIKAVKGQVHLVGANEVTINLNGNSIVDLTVNKGVLDALVENKGAVYADGGEIYLTTNAVDELLKGVVNNEGIIEANSFEGVTGYVELFAHGGEAKIGGSITALEGFVETSGKEFTFNDATIKAGEWLIDPVNVTIDDSLATAIETQLSSGDATITTGGGGSDGNIYVNSEIEWSTANSLYLDAFNNIYINKSITATNDNGKLALFYGRGAANANNTSDYFINAPINLKAGGNFITLLGSDGPLTTWTVVNTPSELQNISLSGKYVLGNDIDLNNVSWTKIGRSNSSFRGSIDGLGHTISNLTYNYTVTTGEFYFGLFGYSSGGLFQNLNLDNFNITAENTNSGAASYTGTLAGSANNTTIKNVYVTKSTVSTSRTSGGLVGSLSNDSEIIDSAFEGGTVNGYSLAGDLVGNMSGSIENSFANANVSSSRSAGGLVGSMIILSNSTGTIKNSYAKGSVTGGNAGGIAGRISSDGTNIINSYASNSVSGTTSAGGIIGYLNNYSASITESYYDKTLVTGMADESSYGKTTKELQTLATFGDAGWDIQGDSTIDKGNPFLAWQQSSNGYTKTWVIGTKVATPDPVDPKPDPVDPKPEVKKIVDSITNQTATTVNLPNVEANTTPNNSGRNTDISFSQGENQMLVSRPIEGQATTRVSLSEARQMQIQNGGSGEEVIVPLSNSSIIQLIDGGVNLPSGVEQEFYLANANTQEEK